VTDSKHAIHVRRAWYDHEPERLTVSVESDGQTGDRYTVFTTSSTWLDPTQVDQLIDYLQYCKVVMAEEDTFDGVTKELKD
jgi:hypothetical protein